MGLAFDRPVRKLLLHRTPVRVGIFLVEEKKKKENQQKNRGKKEEKTKLIFGTAKHKRWGLSHFFWYYVCHVWLSGKFSENSTQQTKTLTHLVIVFTARVDNYYSILLYDYSVFYFHAAPCPGDCQLRVFLLDCNPTADLTDSRRLISLCGLRAKIYRQGKALPDSLTPFKYAKVRNLWFWRPLKIYRVTNTPTSIYIYIYIYIYIFLYIYIYIYIIYIYIYIYTSMNAHYFVT